MTHNKVSNEPKCIQTRLAISEKHARREKMRICRLRHLNGYISETGSVRHETSKLNQRLNSSFQTSLSAFKSIQPSPRNMRGEKKCEFVAYVTLTVISPEPKVSAMSPPNLINDSIVAFK